MVPYIFVVLFLRIWLTIIWVKIIFVVDVFVSLLFNNNSYVWTLEGLKRCELPKPKSLPEISD